MSPPRHLAAGIALALCGSLASGCIAWRTHLDPGVAEFPDSVRTDVAPPTRLRLDVRAWGPDPETGADVLTPSDEDLVALVRLLRSANAVRDAGPSLTFADATLRVEIRARNLGVRWQSILTLATLGLVPYFGGREVRIEAALFDAKGEPVAAWTNRAEAAQVAHLLLLTGWGVELLGGLRTDALKGLVVRLVTELAALPNAAGDRAATGSGADAPLKRR